MHPYCECDVADGVDEDDDLRLLLQILCPINVVLKVLLKQFRADGDQTQKIEWAYKHVLIETS